MSEFILKPLQPHNHQQPLQPNCLNLVWSFCFPEIGLVFVKQMENHTLATQSDLDQVRMAVIQLAQNLPLIHRPAPHNATQFNNFRSRIIQSLTSQLSQPPSVQVHDLLAEMTDQTRDLAHQIPMDMLETKVAALRDQVNDLQSQVNDLQNQSPSAVSKYVEHHIPRLDSLILGLQSQLAITVTPSIDGFNRRIGNLQIQVDASTRTIDLHSSKSPTCDCIRLGLILF